ncbi:hypothetical protein Tco_0994111 [Tanacetum coccineum]
MLFNSSSTLEKELETLCDRDEAAEQQIEFIQGEFYSYGVKTSINWHKVKFGAAGVTSTKSGFPEFYKELEAKILGEGAQLMELQFLQLELRLGKNPSRSFRPVKSAEILWQIWASSSFEVSLAHDGSWSKWEPSLWLCG